MTQIHRYTMVAHPTADTRTEECRPSVDEFTRISGISLTTGHESLPERPYVYGAHRALAERTMDLAKIAFHDTTLRKENNWKW